jgi:hypothetical protein
VRIIRLPRLYRLLRMVRLIRLVKILKRTNPYHRFAEIIKIKPTGARLISFFITVLIFTHLASCLWILVAAVNDFDPDTWVFYEGL